MTLADVGHVSPFQLKIGSNGTPCLTHRDRFVTEVSFPPATTLFEQKTSRGVPFCDIASMQGWDVLVFAYLWPCEFAKARMACKYCHCGHFTQQEIIEGRFEDFRVDARDVAEVIHFGVNVEKTVRHLQITGGSTFHATEEIDRYVEVLRAIDQVAGRANISGELLVYVTPPADPRDVRQAVRGGGGTRAVRHGILDEGCLREMCPGKAKWTGAEPLAGHLALHRPDLRSQSRVQRVRRWLRARGEYSCGRRASSEPRSCANPHGLAPPRNAQPGKMCHTRLGILSKTQQRDGRDLPEVCGRAVWRHRLQRQHQPRHLESS